MPPTVNSPGDSPAPRLWNPRLLRDEFVAVRHELIDPARPELGTQPPPSPENWIWKGRIRPGDLVVIVGDTASGKTTLLCDWMSRITHGLPFPGDPEHFRREPGEVLLFNGADSFVDTIQPRLAVSRADLGRVSLVTPALQAWSGKPSEIPAQWEKLAPAAYETRDCRSGLHRKSGQKWLANFLKNRTQVQMVVIDHLSHHLQADSERKLSQVIIELTQIARETNVVIVLSQRPNAYRNGLGPSEFLKSGELIDSARSIWRVVRPKDETVEARSLQCLKLSQYPALPDAETPWGLFWGPRQELQWVPGAAPKYSHSKLAHNERLLDHAIFCLRNHLKRAGGVAEFHTLWLAAKALKIPQSIFMQALLMPEFDIDYEPVGTDELIQVIGFPEDMARRRVDPNPPALKIKCPPGAAESTAEPDPSQLELAGLLKCNEVLHEPPAPPPRSSPNFRNTFPGDKPPAPPQAPQHPPANPAPHVNLRKPSYEERVDDAFTSVEEGLAQVRLGTPPGWLATADQKVSLQQLLTTVAEQIGDYLPGHPSAGPTPPDIWNVLEQTVRELKAQAPPPRSRQQPAPQQRNDGERPPGPHHPPGRTLGPKREAAPDQSPPPTRPERADAKQPPVTAASRPEQSPRAATPGSYGKEPSASWSSANLARACAERGFEPWEEGLAGAPMASPAIRGPNKSDTAAPHSPSPRAHSAWPPQGSSPTSDTTARVEVANQARTGDGAGAGTRAGFTTLGGSRATPLQPTAPTLADRSASGVSSDGKLPGSPQGLQEPLRRDGAPTDSHDVAPRPATH